MTRFHDLLCREGFEGSYDAVRRYARRWTEARRKDAGDDTPAFIPLLFPPSDAYQFDWSHEDVEIAGKPMRVKVAQMRLCASRAVYVRAYPRETQGMVSTPMRGALPSSAAFPCATAEHEQIAAAITLETLLQQQRQALHALTHIRVAQRDPHPGAGRGHRRALNAAATRPGGAAAKVLSCLPRGRSMIIAGCSAALAAAAPPSISASAKSGVGNASGRSASRAALTSSNLRRHG